MYNINVMAEKKDPHEAQWKKESKLNLDLFNKTGKAIYKARHEACERLLVKFK